MTFFFMRLQVHKSRDLLPTPFFLPARGRCSGCICEGRALLSGLSMCAIMPGSTSTVLTLCITVPGTVQAGQTKGVTLGMPIEGDAPSATYSHFLVLLQQQSRKVTQLDD